MSIGASGCPTWLTLFKQGTGRQQQDEKRGEHDSIQNRVTAKTKFQKERAAIDLHVPNTVVRGIMPFPEFNTDATIPAYPIFRDGQLTMMPDNNFGNNGDGFLVDRWFGDNIWEFDYLRQKVSRLSYLAENQKPVDHSVDLGFQIDRERRRTMRFPRIRIEVEGSSFDVLFDTGASATLTQDGAAALGDSPGKSVGTSFIRRGIFDAWKREHPNWTVIANADTVRGQTYAMIQVHELMVGGHAVGPVWFTVRPDGAFLDRMSSMMDAPVHGAIGGSALRYFRIIVDYPQLKAYFFVN